MSQGNYSPLFMDLYNLITPVFALIDYCVLNMKSFSVKQLMLISDKGSSKKSPISFLNW